MRRAEREVLDVAFMHKVLEDAGEICLALNTGGAPYVLPVNFVFHAGGIYFHCAPEGRKLDLWQVDPRVGFTAAVDIQVEKTTTRYRCVCGTGRILPVEAPDLKNAALKAFARKYKAPCHFPVSQEKFAYTRVMRIEIETLTGKYSHPNEGPRPVPHFER